MSEESEQLSGGGASMLRAGYERVTWRDQRREFQGVGEEKEAQVEESRGSYEG